MSGNRTALEPVCSVFKFKFNFKFKFKFRAVSFQHTDSWYDVVMFWPVGLRQVCVLPAKTLRLAKTFNGQNGRKSDSCIAVLE